MELPEGFLAVVRFQKIVFGVLRYCFSKRAPNRETLLSVSMFALGEASQPPNPSKSETLRGGQS